ncbi:MAG: proline--tRNA ligase [Elusimicrobia bacterium CG_4_10_14_0_2_um_filter_56_8]|nr:MAG: proline--tRNA ligase [Elusimicrobia bacterium CG1_02_56_21]PJA17900.1 MAG: proline--tRNA ligase [Elusimicrobia bacterium CG_4_10_14_0_2_um_filter_56_8]
MKISKYFLPTLREAPQDADNVSVKLMFRSGMIRKLASGIYEWLPVGLRVLQKVENIVREELNRVDGLEVRLPVIQPKELWMETGRWQVYGKELLRITDRKESEFCFAPTAEEVITNMVRRDVSSYRQLPIMLYQFGLKFRDEIRPRFGVMRSREFLMKDAYSFHASDEDAQKWYGILYGAYEKIFTRCGLAFKPVEADSGPIGGNHSHEFMVIADTGEAEIALCDCGYAANTEKAEVSEPPARQADPSKLNPMKEVATPGLYTVADVAKFLKMNPKQFIKTLFFLADGQPVMALVRGDHELNENKLRRFLGVAELEKAPEHIYEAIAGCPAGFAGPADIKNKYVPGKDTKPLGRIVADHALKNVFNGVSGANKKDTHATGINLGRDYSPDAFADIHVAAAGDLCPKCSKPLGFKRGIEVGQTFKLGTKYSKSLNCSFVNEHQKEEPMVMGCYGIGVTRTVAAAIEQGHDDWGIIWPPAIAPFEFSLVSIESEDKEVAEASSSVYEAIKAEGMEALWDDRDERPGVKFKDADLVGLPWRIVVSSKTLKDGECEFKRRASRDAVRWKLGEVPARLKELKAEIR